jgi:hypothetical protein
MSATDCAVFAMLQEVRCDQIADSILASTGGSHHDPRSKELASGLYSQAYDGPCATG